MNIDFYKNEIEKLASQDETLKNNNLDKVKSGAKRIVNSAITAKLNGGAQNFISDAGAVAGTLLAKSRGASIGKAVATGGLGGMAIGDLVGAATIPTKQLYKKHREEFGENPDMKSLAAVLGANVLPTAALWGGALGIPKVRKSLQKSLTQVPGHLKTVSKLPIDAVKDYNLINKASKAGDVDGVLALGKAMQSNYKKNSEDAIGAVKKMLGTTAALGVAGNLVEIPTYIATPQNIIDAKKKIIEDKAQQV